MIKLAVELDDSAFLKKLQDAVNKNPNIMYNVLKRAMIEFQKIGVEASLNGGNGLGQRTGKTFKSGFKEYKRSSKKYVVGGFWLPLANIYQGQKTKSNLPNIAIFKLAEKAFKDSDVLYKILKEEVEKVYVD